MPIDLSQLTNLMTGKAVEEGVRTLIRDDQSIVGLSLHELRQTTADLEFLSLGHLLFDEDEQAPVLPSLSDIEAAIADVVTRSDSMPVMQPTSHRRELDELWLEVSRPLRKWFYETATTSLAQHVLHRMASEDHASEGTQRVAAANVATSVDTAQRSVELADWLGRVEMMRAVSRDDGMIAMLTHIAGRSVNEIAELMGWSLAEAERRTALATAMIEMLGATDESTART